VLAEIILRKKYGAEPEMLSMPPQLESMLQKCDAALIIGDPALRIDPAQSPHRALDLGAEWTAMTGLPFVFAVWGARRPYDPEPFSSSLKFGLNHIDDIVAREHAARGIAPELAREYLTRHIGFELGPQERAGLELFLEYAAEIRQTEPRTVSV
jgi:predicted solute-binding protein